MKAVILAGGYGTRISEETHLIPKPMVTIGGKPILWHIMKSYSHHGINDFIICLGYKGEVIREYFAHYRDYACNVTIDLKSGQHIIHDNHAEAWKVTLVDTGEDTMTGGRLRRIAPFLDKTEDFCLTYGDGVSNINIRKLVAFHKAHGKLATLTAVLPTQRYGILEFDGDTVSSFREKPADDASYINGGFFVLSPKVLSYIEGDAMLWEKEPLETLAREGELKAFRHPDFWQCMDTLRESKLLNRLWDEGNAPWKSWE